MADVDDLPAQPDLSEFKQRNLTIGASSPWLVNLLRYAHVTTGDLGPGTPPHEVPWEVIGAMGFDPVVRVGERLAIQPVLDPQVYYVRDPRPEMVAEVEAWLWPILPKLLRAILGSVAWGAVPMVLGWTMSNLRTNVRPKQGKPTERVIPDHVHFGRVDTIFPAYVETELDAQGDIVALRYEGQRFGCDRARLVLWDDEWGQLIGQGSRRAAYRGWFSKQLIRLWRGRYLERSVDPPRLGWAPAGKQTLDDGQTVSPVELVTNALLALNGGGAFVMPSTREVNGEKKYEVEVQELPDRAEVWDQALRYEDGDILTASLVPTAVVDAQESTHAGAKVPAETFADVVESYGRFAALAVQDIVQTVHFYRYGADDPCPEIGARELPKAKRKLLMDVFSSIVGDVRRLQNGREYSLGRMITHEILDMMGLPYLPPEEVATAAPIEPAPGGPGPDQQRTSDREERREAARTDSGEESTGAPGQGGE